MPFFIDVVHYKLMLLLTKKRNSGVICPHATNFLPIFMLSMILKQKATPSSKIYFSGYYTSDPE